jgi:hypothetical protein
MLPGLVSGLRSLPHDSEGQHGQPVRWPCGTQSMEQGASWCQADSGTVWTGAQAPYDPPLSCCESKAPIVQKSILLHSQAWSSVWVGLGEHTVWSPHPSVATWCHCREMYRSMAGVAQNAKQPGSLWLPRSVVAQWDEAGQGGPG